MVARGVATGPLGAGTVVLLCVCVCLGPLSHVFVCLLMSQVALPIRLAKRQIFPKRHTCTTHGRVCTAPSPPGQSPVLNDTLQPDVGVLLRVA